MFLASDYIILRFVSIVCVTSNEQNCMHTTLYPIAVTVKYRLGLSLFRFWTDDWLIIIVQKKNPPIRNIRIRRCVTKLVCLECIILKCHFVFVRFTPGMHNNNNNIIYSVSYVIFFFFFVQRGLMTFVSFVVAKTQENK